MNRWNRWTMSRKSRSPFVCFAEEAVPNYNNLYNPEKLCSKSYQVGKKYSNRSLEGYSLFLPLVSTSVLNILTERSPTTNWSIFQMSYPHLICSIMSYWFDARSKRGEGISRSPGSVRLVIWIALFQRLNPSPLFIHNPQAAPGKRHLAKVHSQISWICLHFVRAKLDASELDMQFPDPRSPASVARLWCTGEVYTVPKPGELHSLWKVCQKEHKRGVVNKN